MKYTHIGAAFVVIPVCLWGLFWLLPNHTVPPMSEDDLSPALVPGIALGAMLLTGIMMLVRALKLTASASTQLDDEFGEDASGIDRHVLLNMVWLAIIFVLAWLIITYVGFEPAMTLVLIVTMLFVGVRRPLTIGLTAVLMPIVLSMAAWFFFSTEMPAVWR